MPAEPSTAAPSVAAPVTIRAATAADLPMLGRLGAQLVALHHDLDAARFLAATPESAHAYAAFLGRQLGRPDVVVLVAERVGLEPAATAPDRGVLGYAYAGVEAADYMALRGPAGVLYDLVVDPAHRGRGVGRVLLEAVLDALAARGAPRVVLSTAAQNAAAQHLFAAAGFRPTMVEMTRELDARASGVRP